MKTAIKLLFLEDQLAKDSRHRIKGHEIEAIHVITLNATLNAWHFREPLWQSASVSLMRPRKFINSLVFHKSFYMVDSSKGGRCFLVADQVAYDADLGANISCGCCLLPSL